MNAKKTILPGGIRFVTAVCMDILKATNQNNS